jgi:protein involved in polysaccharide export with SLBB domain
MRLLQDKAAGSIAFLCALAVLFMQPGCASNQPPPKPLAPMGTNGFREDPLRIGDRIQVELSGIAELVTSQPQEINAEGKIHLTHIGDVKAAGKSPSALEKEIEGRYVPQWYPHVTVTVTPLVRYYYVAGQVNNNSGGRIMYGGPTTVLRAISSAGDFTPFANRRKVQITRADGVTVENEDCLEALKHPEKDLPVYPGDFIFVGRRGF